MLTKNSVEIIRLFAAFLVEKSPPPSSSPKKGLGGATFHSFPKRVIIIVTTTTTTIPPWFRIVTQGCFSVDGWMDGWQHAEEEMKERSGCSVLHSHSPLLPLTNTVAERRKVDKRAMKQGVHCGKGFPTHEARLKEAPFVEAGYAWRTHVL